MRIRTSAAWLRSTSLVLFLGLTACQAPSLQSSSLPTAKVSAVVGIQASVPPPQTASLGVRGQGTEREERVKSPQIQASEEPDKKPAASPSPSVLPSTKPSVVATAEPIAQSHLAPRRSRSSSGGGGGGGARPARVTASASASVTPEATSSPSPVPTPQASPSGVVALAKASCSFQIGTNLATLEDWSTEIPFVDLMHLARQWVTYEPGDPTWTWDTGHEGELSLRPDGYPTHLPQDLPGTSRPTAVRTIWADVQAWPAGTYTLLYAGTGQLRVQGNISHLQQTEPGRLSFDLNPPQPGDSLGLELTQSDAKDPIHDMHLLLPGTEATYQSQPYYSAWLQKVQAFSVLRLMDWGQTNNWGYGHDAVAARNAVQRVDWAGRAPLDYYTWTTPRGIPYEEMIRMANTLGKNIWINIPHDASDEYIREMARLFRDQLDPHLTLYVEYSNETWNWMFGQTHWLNDQSDPNTPWPERIVPFIQNALDIFSAEFNGQTDRLVRVVGVQASYLDVSRRIVRNLRPGSFDAFAPAAYFHFNNAAYQTLSSLGASATAADVIRVVRDSLPESLGYLQDMKTQLGDALGLSMVFYEGGQHLTPNPWGSDQPYNQALVDAQRDPGMYQIYMDWFNGLHQIMGDEPTAFATYSFVGTPSLRYGSWGMLEALNQDLSVLPAPKYEAIMDQLQLCGS